MLRGLVAWCVLLAGCGPGGWFDTTCHCSYPIDAPPALCDPIRQDVCTQGEACSWIVEWREGKRYQELGCAAPGMIPIGDACTRGEGPSVCEPGAQCSAGTCRRICGWDQECDSTEHCVPYDYVSQHDQQFGVCVPRCEPLSQSTAAGELACGSTDPTMPARGCYGVGYNLQVEFACAPAITSGGGHGTIPPAPIHTNSCAPGFIPVVHEPTGGNKIRCHGLCAPLDIDNTPAHVGNALGDASVVGKLVGDVAPSEGRATCAPSIKGGARSECRYLWPLARLSEPDRLGVCIDYEEYRYDADGDGARETTYPSCTTLPPRSASTPGRHDDARDWGCQRAPAIPDTTTVSDFKLPSGTSAYPIDPPTE